MDKIIDVRFERVEKPLATLINSISTYNPSPTHAQDLLQADQELSSGLSLLSTHQTNHARILSLRNLSTSLDTQISSTLSLLASTRQNLITTPATTFPSAQQTQVSYKELLNYAKRISKNTLPSAFREADLSTGIPENATKDSATGTPREKETTNGAPTPTNAGDGSIMNIDPLSGLALRPRQNGLNDIEASTPTNAEAPPKTGDTKLPPILQDWLDPHREYSFVPWPKDDIIKRGALAVVQSLVERGVEIEGWDGDVEEERRKVEEEEREEEMERELDRRRRLSIDQGVGGMIPQQVQQQVQVQQQQQHGGERRREERRKFALDDLEDEDDD